MLWDDALQADIAAQHRAGLLRRLLPLGSRPGPRVTLDGADVLMFGSNNYLGLAADPRARDAAAEATSEFGVGSSGSRLLSGNHVLAEALEAEIAAFKRTPSAIVFASGYAANVGAIPALVGRDDLILSDELNHASIIDACRLSRAETRVYPHRDAGAAAAILRSERQPFRRALIVTDGVFSVDGDVAPLPELCDIAEQYDAGLYIDDAHGVGVLGDGGRGSVSHFGLAGREPIIEMGTLSKALGSLGGYVAGSQAVVDTLRQRARSFIFSHGLTPGDLNASRACLDALIDDPSMVTQLGQVATRLREGLTARGCVVGDHATPIVPVAVGDAVTASEIAAACLGRGLYAPAIRPPTVPAGTSRLRLSVMATHTHAHVDEAVEIVASCAEEAGIL
jgi:8-amino-7-oxononanoate synthase